MHDLALLRDLLILVAFAIPTVALAERVKIPSVVALLITGVLIGPSGLGLIGQSEDVAALAELGVVLLLFEIGLEISLARVVRLRAIVLVGGLLQVAVTIAATAGIGVMVGLPPAESVAFGCLVALSSTAIVLKLYRDRGELDSPHGRVVLGILLFQDLAVVPLMVLVPILAGGSEALRAGGVGRIAVSLLAVAGVVGVGRLVVPWVLEKVVRLRERDLFTLTVAFFGLGAAFVTASVGLSLALGAFLAGIVISESEYGAQAVSDVLPFRAVFSGIFFTSVGMLLDLQFIADQLVPVLAASIGVVVGKAVIVAAVTRVALRRSASTGFLSGVGLAQIGEFSFVLAGVAAVSGLLPEPRYQVFLAATVISMLAAPFLIERAAALASVVPSVAALRGSEGGSADGASGVANALRDHTIIVGFGMSGHHLARVLRAAHLPYIVLEMNGQTVRTARQALEPIYFADGTRRDVLLHAGAKEARVIVFNISSPLDERRGVTVARELNPSAQIVVRTRTVDAIGDLERRGATDVVVEEFEAALELFERVLRHYRIPVNTIGAELDAVRAEHYGVLRGLPKETLRLDDLRYLGVHHALELVAIEEGAEAVGGNPTSLDLRSRTGATVIAVIREGKAHYTPDPLFSMLPGDTVVLVGPGPSLQLAAKVFRKPSAAD
ncbi:MAG TPA: cation:proton antiporter [Gemmatimonadales bacterium]